MVVLPIYFTFALIQKICKMLEYLRGTIVETSPAHAVIENNQSGYFLNISLATYSALSKLPKEDVKLFVHEIIREDLRALYGFLEASEREMFRSLISVSGVGANTARMILSSYSAAEIKTAILNSDVNLLKSIKGIGLKSAQRLIVELKDKIGKVKSGAEIFNDANNTIKDEALSALVMLGFSKSMVDKVLTKILSENSDISVEELVKLSLKRL